MSRFDPAIDSVRRVVSAALWPQAVKDALHGTWLGHPLHPVLAQVPVGAWISAGVLDAVPPLRPAAALLIGTRVAAAVPTALAGAADWAEQAAGVRRLGAVHALANSAAPGLYVGSLVARAKGRDGLGRLLAYGGLGLAGGSAAIGGHLAYAQSSGCRSDTGNSRDMRTGPAAPGGTGRPGRGRTRSGVLRRGGDRGCRVPARVACRRSERAHRT